MTRFARARGSKACNEKTPGEATKWKDMKSPLRPEDKGVKPSPSIAKAVEVENLVSKNKRENVGTIDMNEENSLSEEIDEEESEDSEDMSEEDEMEEEESGEDKEMDCDEENSSDNEPPEISDNKKPGGNKLRQKKGMKKNVFDVDSTTNKKKISEGGNKRFQKKKNEECGPSKRKLEENQQEKGGIFGTKKRMIAKGISGKNEKIVKGENKKNVKRPKERVCFGCREGGHVMANCPKNPSGICYKCGSTEHTSSKCSSKETGFKFAKCFLCQKEGHIVRHCPENQNGLYPNGGGCLSCGEVTHFKKDCPKLQKKKAENAVTARFGTPKRDIDSLEDEDNLNLPPTKTRKTFKVIKMKR